MDEYGAHTEQRLPSRPTRARRLLHGTGVSLGCASFFRWPRGEFPRSPLPKPPGAQTCGRQSRGCRAVLSLCPETRPVLVAASSGVRGQLGWGAFSGFCGGLRPALLRSPRLLPPKRQAGRHQEIFHNCQNIWADGRLRGRASSRLCPAPPPRHLTLTLGLGGCPDQGPACSRSALPPGLLVAFPREQEERGRGGD